MASRDIYQPLYDCIQKFNRLCLIQDQSMLWPDQKIWTLENLRLWKIFVVDKPINDPAMSFPEKLEIQLTGAPLELWALAADIHYIYYLPSSQIKFETRLESIRWAAGKGGRTIPSDQDPIWIPHKQGFTRTTMKYHFRFAQFYLLTEFAGKIKKQENIERILSDHTKVQSMLDSILESVPKKGERAYDFRHALLYLMFPDRYERIISTGSKEKIVGRYGEYITNPSHDIDNNLFQIREGLAMIRPEGKGLDFYSDLRQEWGTDEEEIITHVDTTKIITEPSTRKIVQTALRLIGQFKNLILYGPPGTGKTYWANQISLRLIDSQLQKAQSKISFLQTIINELPVYAILALAMYIDGKASDFTVPQLEQNDLMQARFKMRPVKNPKNHIWGDLQAHTMPESKTVKFSLRSEPFLFDKTNDSKWHLSPEGIKYLEDTLTEPLTLIRKGPPTSNKPEDFIYKVTFHQSYAYEDFVEGIRPKTDQADSSVLSFELKPGIFKVLCSIANDDPTNQYVLIIDEINRGNIAKIFGELMTLIEADKRDVLSVELPYSKSNFLVPKNLSIIATMNTTDRSIALLDVALRRRFVFLELMPEPELLDSIDISLTEDKLNIGAFLRIVNERITKLRGVDFQIGHSYFLPLINIADPQKRFALFQDIWVYQIIPLLKEYFYGQVELMRQVLPGFFVDVDESPLTQDGFVKLSIEDLIAALNK